MRKGLILSAILSLGLVFTTVGCGGKSASSSSDSSTYTIEITNKTELQAEWIADDESRTVNLTITKDGVEQNVTQAVQDGELTLASSDTAVATALGRVVTPVAAGTATITATYGGASDSVNVTITAADPHGKSAEDPLTVAEALEVCEQVGSESTKINYYVKGVVTSIGSAYSEEYKNITILIGDKKTDTDTLTCYRVVPESTVDPSIIGPGSEVLVCGTLTTYGETPEMNAGGKILTATQGEVAKEIEATVAEALEACKALANNTSSLDIYIITGYIVNVVSSGTFYMSDTKGEVAASQELFEVYGWKGDNAAECTIDAKVKVKATLKHYVSTTTEGKYAYETDVIKNIEVLEAGREAEIELKGPTALTAVVAGTEYYAGVTQTTVNKVVFVDGGISSNVLSTGKLADAAKVVFETATGGYLVKIGSKYLSLTTAGKASLGTDSSKATVWSWSSVANSIYATASGDNYYIGAYSSYTTLSASKESYVIADNAVKSGQFPIQFYAIEALVNPTELQLDQKAGAAVGADLQLEARMNPYNADISKVTFTSSDETVATVAAGGVVTPLKAGTTTITATFSETIKDTCVVTVIEVDLGTAEAPLTVAEALATGEKLQDNGIIYSPAKIYVQGDVELADGVFYNNQYFGKWNIVDGEDKLYVVNAKSAEDIIAYENDEVLVSGFLTYEEANGFELLKTADGVYPAVEKIVTRGTSTVTVGTFENATISELSATSAANLGTVTFKAAAAEGYKVSKVYATSAAEKAELTATDGVYTATVKGNTVLSVEVSADNEKVSTLTVDGFDAFFESSSTSTTVHEASADGVNYGAYGLKTSSSAANATAGTKYDYIMLMGGTIYNTSAPDGMYVKNVTVTYTDGTGTSGSVLITFGASALSTRVTTGSGTTPVKGGTLSADNADTTLAYFNISNLKTNNTQIVSIAVTFAKVAA